MLEESQGQDLNNKKSLTRRLDRLVESTVEKVTRETLLEEARKGEQSLNTESPSSVAALICVDRKPNQIYYDTVLATVVLAIIVLINFKLPLAGLTGGGIALFTLVYLFIRIRKRHNEIRSVTSANIRLLAGVKPDPKSTEFRESRTQRLKDLENLWDNPVAESNFLILMRRAGVRDLKHLNRLIAARTILSVVLAIVSVFFINLYGIVDPRCLLTLAVICMLFYLPEKILQVKGNRRAREFREHLPLFAHQVVIAASSGLDLGKSLQEIMNTSLDRDRGNILTHALTEVFDYMVNGLSLPEALQAEGERLGIEDINRFFMALAAVSRNGGNLTRTLSAMAEDAQTIRFLEVEHRITRLPVIQTGPLFLIFTGFFALVSAGLVATVSENLNL